jgi:hypothetical protein
LQALGESLTPLYNKAADRIATANEMAHNLKSSSDYVSVTATAAQGLANRGALVILAYRNLKGHGHVTTIRPEGIRGDPVNSPGGLLINDIGRTVAVRAATGVLVAQGSDVSYYTPVRNVSVFVVLLGR